VDYGLHEQLVAELVGRVERETHRASLLALDVDADRVRIDDRLYQRVLFEGTHFHCMRCTRAALPRRAAMCCPGARRLREFVVATTLSEAWPAES
jgi:hypothetical protein